MLNVSIRVADKTIKLPSILPGDAPENSGSVTDLKAEGSQIILFFHPREGYATVKKSTAGFTEEIGGLRVTVPLEGLKLIKKLEGKERFELAFLSKYGPATLMLELV